MNKKQLLPKEKERLDKFMRSVSRLAKENILPQNSAFLMRQQMRAILIILGSVYPDHKLIGDSLEIMADRWPFKKIRLRKLINGRRAQ